MEIPGRIQYKFKSKKVGNSRSHKSIEKLSVRNFMAVNIIVNPLKGLLMREI